MRIPVTGTTKKVRLKWSPKNTSSDLAERFAVSAFSWRVCPDTGMKQPATLRKIREKEYSAEDFLQSEKIVFLRQHL